MFNKTFVAAAAAAFALSGAAHATVVGSLINLNNGSLSDADIVSNQFAGVTISATTNGGGGANDFAIAIDTGETMAGGDSDNDLASPFDDPTTPGDDMFDPGIVLALAEGDCDAMAGTCRADDNATGGELVIDFDAAAIFNSFAVFDIATGALTLTLSLDGMTVLSNFIVPGVNTNTGDNPNNNLFTRIDLGGVLFDRAVFAFRDSGAIGELDITEVPAPAALPLFLAGLFGLRFARGLRRRRA